MTVISRSVSRGRVGGTRGLMDITTAGSVGGGARLDVTGGETVGG